MLKRQPLAYLGRIFVISDEIQKMLSAIIEVESKAPFFDIILDIPQNYKEIFFQSPADLPLGVTLFNLGNIGETNVNLEYFVKDFEGNVILRESDIVTVDKQVSFTKTLKIPPFLRPGEYAIIVYARYGDGIGTASDLFGVTDKTAAVEAPLIVEFKGLTWIISILSLIVVIAIIFTLLQNYRLKNIEKSHPIVIKRYKSEAKKIQPMSEEAKKMQAKLTSHLGLLKKSYDAGYINQEAYDKAKSTIDGMLQKLK
jgi:Sec-independent protein translocase protein TatA